MVEPDAIQRVLKRKHALNFVRLDHCDEHVPDRRSRLTLSYFFREM